MSIVTYNMTDTMNTQQAAHHYQVSERTILRWIKSGKLKAEQEQGHWCIRLDEQDVRQDDRQAMEQLQSENAHLRELLSRQDEQLARRDEQIDHLTQLLAMQSKTTAALTEQLDTSRALIEDMRHRKLPIWNRVFRWT